MTQAFFCRAFAALACTAWLAGCSGGLPEAANAKTGEEAMRRALQAWKAGESAESLQQRKPPIWFNEPECAAGHRLLDFEVVEPVERYGRQLRCAVKLSLQDKKDGAPFEKRIGYQIETNPHIVIAREGL